MKPTLMYWIITVLGIVWFGIGGYDYVMTNLGDEAYLSILTEQQRAWIDARPTWFTAVWAISIWSSVLGSLLMLIRRKLAGHMFALSTVGFLISAVWSYAITSPTAFEMTGWFGVGFSAAILASLILFVTYCGNKAQSGVLR